MARVRISTTVDADLLSRGRELLSGPDGRLVDAALQALVDVGDADRERAALDGNPYENDPALSWTVPDGPAYDGAIPPDGSERHCLRGRRRAYRVAKDARGRDVNASADEPRDLFRESESDEQFAPDREPWRKVDQ